MRETTTAAGQRLSRPGNDGGSAAGAFRSRAAALAVTGLLVALIAILLGILSWLRQDASQDDGPPIAVRTSAPRPPPTRPEPPSPALSLPTRESLAIHGVVVDERDAPVVGAEVLVTSHESVRSGPGGRFRIAVAGPGRYYLNAHSETSAAGPLPLQVDDAPISVVVRLHAGVRLAVELVSAVDGRPLPGARGSLTFSTMMGDGGQVGAIAGADGVLRFPVAALGQYRVFAEADGFAPATRLLTWNDRAGLAWLSRIALEPGVVLTGRVVDESGAPVADAEVTARAAPRARTQMAYRPRPPERQRPPVVTDSGGRFRYPVPIGQALVLVARHDRAGRGQSAPVIASGPIDVEIKMRAGGTLRGRVVDRAGRPVGRAAVSDGPVGDVATHATYTDGDGRFVLEGIEPGRRQAVLVAETRGARASPVLVSLPAGFARPIELVVEHDLRIAGIVLDSDGAPVPDAIVHFQHVVPPSFRPPPANPTAVLEPMASGEIRADGAGAFSISGLGPGQVQLLVRAPSAAADRASPPLMVLTRVAAGDEEVVIALPAPSRIRGRIVASSGRPATGIEISLAPFGGPVRVADAEGRFELGQVDPTPGTYQVSIAAEGSAPRTIEARVAAGQTTDLGTIALEPGRTLRGRVLESAGGGPVANALVSVDGPAGARVASCRTDELGGFKVPVPDGPMTVHAAVPGVGGSRFVLVPDGQSSVELRLPETGRLVVNLTGPAAAGAVTVSATRTDPADGGLRIFLLDRDPAGLTFGADVSPGEYVVRARRGTGLAAMKEDDENHEVAVAIAAGQTETVTVAVVDPGGSAAGRAERAAGSDRSSGPD